MIKERIEEIVRLREDLLNELKSLQESCPHNEYHIGTYSWRVGSYNQMRVCEECGKCIDPPSDDELEEFNDEMEKKYNIGKGAKIYNRN